MESKNITFSVSPPLAGFEYPAAGGPHGACQCGSAPVNAAHAPGPIPDIRGALPGIDLVRLDSAAEWIITTTTGAVVSRNANSSRLHRIFGRYVIARHTPGSTALTLECIEGRIFGHYTTEGPAAAAPLGASPPPPALREIDGRLIIVWPNEITIVGFNFATIATIQCAHIIDTADPRIWVIARRRAAGPLGGPAAAAGPDDTKKDMGADMTCYFDIKHLRPIHILEPGATFRAWAAARIAAESTPAGTQFRRFMTPAE